MSLTAQHIITVTQGGILYRNWQDVICWIDFVACNQNWSFYQGDTTDTRCVGWRNTGRILDVEFFTEPARRTRFKFISYLQRDTILLEPMLALGGWYTKDLSS